VFDCVSVDGLPPSIEEATQDGANKIEVMAHSGARSGANGGKYYLFVSPDY
jgi:hypothetical protein